MRALVAFALLLLAGCPRTLSETDRQALQDFRTVERACLARASEILYDESIQLSDTDELVKAIQRDVVKPWQEMRSRLSLETRKLGDDLAKVLGRYLDERQIGWEELAKAMYAELNGLDLQPGAVNHRWQYRESNEAADADQKILDAKLAALKLPALPPVPATPIVELDPPPPGAKPGAAFFLTTNNSVVRLDDNGFQTIATDIQAMDVLPDGTMWACGGTHVVRWDGTRTTDYKANVSPNTCTALPDGSLWVVEDQYFSGTDQYGRFDQKTWKVTNKAIGEKEAQTQSVISDREGHLYAVNRNYNGGGDRILVFGGAKGDAKVAMWRDVPLKKDGSRLYLNHLFRGGDGRVWATYDVSPDHEHSSTGFARLTPTGGEDPVYAADYFQAEQMYPFVDSAGVFTVLDPRRNLLVQGKKERKLPMPIAERYRTQDSSGPFAIDGAGRIWIDLVDGINVIDKGGKRTVYPRGSIDGIRANVKAIVVTGAGPRLVAPGPVLTRTIKGSIIDAGKLELVMCASPRGYSCPPGLPSWKTWSDAEGNFAFEKVPRWSFEMFGIVGITGEKTWQTVDTKCCADGDTLEPARFQRGAIY